MHKILKFNSKTSILEIMDSSFPIGKVQINCISLDAHTQKQISKIKYYMPVDKFESLLTMIENGDLMQRYYNGNDDSLFTDQGGSNGEARIFNIRRGNKKPILICCNAGKGNYTANGGISLSKVEKKFSMGFTFEQLFSFKLVDKFLQSYITLGYMNMAQLWNNEYKKVTVQSSLMGNDLNYELNWLNNLDVRRTNNYFNSFPMDYSYHDGNNFCTKTFIIRDIPRDMLNNIRSRQDSIEIVYNENKKDN